jgi:hypothetical protein
MCKFFLQLNLSKFGCTLYTGRIKSGHLPRRTFESKKKWPESGEHSITTIFITCTLHQMLFKVIKSWRMRWAGNVACLGEMRNAYKILVGESEGKRDHLEDVDVDGNITLEWILENMVGRCGLDASGSG